MLNKLPINGEQGVHRDKAITRTKRKRIAHDKPAIANIVNRVKQNAGLKQGDIFTGHIQSITPFGIFISVASKKCLLHVSSITGLTSKEMKKRQINRFFSINDKISVKVSLVSNGKVSLNWVINDDESYNKALDILNRFRNNAKEYEKVLKALSASCTDGYKL